MEERAGTILKPSLAEKIEQDFQEMLSWLPKRVSSILDIGSGYAYIDDHLIRHYGGAGYGGAALAVHLLDGDKTVPSVGKERIGYREKTRAWGDRNVGVQRLQAEFPACRVYGHPPDPSLRIPCDLILSRRAWGHHFPIATYIRLADRSLRPGGRIITDIRLGRGHYEDSLTAFRAYGFQVIADNIEVRSGRSVKCRRMVLGRWGG